MQKQYYILWFYDSPKIVSKHENEINGDLYVKLKTIRSNVTTMFCINMGLQSIDFMISISDYKVK